MRTNISDIRHKEMCQSKYSTFQAYLLFKAKEYLRKGFANYFLTFHMLHVYSEEKFSR